MLFIALIESLKPKLNIQLNYWLHTMISESLLMLVNYPFNLLIRGMAILKNHYTQPYLKEKKTSTFSTILLSHYVCQNKGTFQWSQLLLYDCRYAKRLHKSSINGTYRSFSSLNENGVQNLTSTTQCQPVRNSFYLQNTSTL